MTIDMDSPVPWAIATAVCLGVALAILRYAWVTREPLIADEPPVRYRHEGAWLTAEELDDADRAAMIRDARNREDTLVAQLDAIWEMDPREPSR